MTSSSAKFPGVKDFAVVSFGIVEVCLLGWGLWVRKALRLWHQNSPDTRGSSEVRMALIVPHWRKVPRLLYCHLNPDEMGLPSWGWRSRYTTTLGHSVSCGSGNRGSCGLSVTNTAGRMSALVLKGRLLHIEMPLGLRAASPEISLVSWGTYSKRKLNHCNVYREEGFSAPSSAPCAGLSSPSTSTSAGLGEPTRQGWIT